jgi:hypothetical protein
MVLSEETKKELLELSRSPSLRRDLETLASHRINPWGQGGSLLMDKLLEFLTQYNEFINHRPRDFKIIVDKVAKL